MPSPPSCSPWQSVQGLQDKAVSPLGRLLKSRFTARATEEVFLYCLCFVFSWNPESLFLNTLKFLAGLKDFHIIKLSNLIGRPLRTKALKRVSEIACPPSCSLGSNSSSLSKFSESSTCTRASCTIKVSKSFQVFAPSPTPSFPTQSCLISIRVVAFIVSARRCHTLLRFS